MDTSPSSSSSTTTTTMMTSSTTTEGNMDITTTQKQQQQTNKSDKENTSPRTSVDQGKSLIGMDSSSPSWPNILNFFFYDFKSP